jgi:class 3 adenylate cyclase/CHASE2 domain-containing sensor protein
MREPFFNLNGIKIMKKITDKIFSNPTPLKRLLIGGIFGAFFGLVIAVLYMLHVFDSLEYLIEDLRTTSFTNYSKIETRDIKSQVNLQGLDIPAKYKIPEEKQVFEGDIIYLSIDDASLEQLEIHDGLSYPWPRSVWAEAVEFLYASDIKSLVFDISFFQGHPKTEPGSSQITKEWQSDERFSDTLARFDDTVLATAFTRSVGSDQFASTVQNAQLTFSEGWYQEAFISLTLAYYNSKSEYERVIAKNVYNRLLDTLKEKIEKEKLDIKYNSFEKQLEYVRNNRENLSKKISKYRLKNFVTDGSVKIDNALNVEPPMDLLIGEPYTYGPSDSLGDVKLTPDSDGVARRTVSVVEFGGNYYPSLTLAGVMESLKFDNDFVNIYIKDKDLYLGDKEKAIIQFNQSTDELKENINSIKSLYEQEKLNTSLDNLLTIINSIDINQENPFPEIEEFINRNERDFARLDMLKKLTDAYYELDWNDYESVQHLDNILNETVELFDSNFFKILRERYLYDINEVLRSFDRDNYKQLIENAKDKLNLIPNEIITNYSMVIQKIVINLIQLGEYDQLIQDEPTIEEYQIKDEDQQKIFNDFETFTINLNSTIRKVNEKKNARIIPLDNNGLLRLKFYGSYKFLPNVSIYKVIKTWKSIKRLWEERVVGGKIGKESFNGDILQLAYQHIRNKALRYSANNPFETILSSKLGDYYLSVPPEDIRMPSSRRFPRSVIQQYGEERLINVMIEELIKVEGRKWYNSLNAKSENDLDNLYYNLLTTLQAREEFSTATEDQIYEFLQRVVPGIMEKIWDISYPDEQIEAFIQNNDGLTNMISSIINGFEVYNPKEKVHWVEYFFYYNDEELKNDIYSQIARDLLEGELGYIQSGEELPDIDRNAWTDFVKKVIDEMLNKIYLWAEDNRYDLLFGGSQEELTLFMKEFLTSIKEGDDLARTLIMEKILFVHPVEGSIELEYLDEDAITIPKEDIDKMSPEDREKLFEEAFENRVALIALGGEILEEYAMLSLERQGMNVNDVNVINTVLDVIDRKPNISPEDLLNALFKIAQDEDTPPSTRNLISNIQLVNPENFKDKVILVMTDAASLLDLRKTPFDSRDAGGNLHGHGILNVLNNDYVYDYNKDYITVPIVIAIGILIGIIAVLLPIRMSIFIFLGTFIAYNVFGILFHYYASSIINMTAVSLSLSIAFLAGITMNFVLETKQKGFIEGAFSQFLAPEILSKLMTDPTKLTLGGETKELTIFFSDIAGFTTLSEQLSPEGLVDILNYYLTKMADIIVVDNNGYVDKYEGDAIMAFWGAPVDDEEHAIKACQAALDNQKKLKDIQEYFQTQGLKAGISIRIGLNTGRVIVGMMGSQKKLNYTVIGDAVNLASRLEGANKQFGTEIMISENTFVHVKERVEVRELDLMRVKGKLVPTRVYELISRKGELTEDKQKIIQIYNQGLKTYRQKEFEKALTKFKECLSIDPDDGPSKTYLKRCEEYIKNPPPEDWDGVFIMTTK